MTDEIRRKTSPLIEQAMRVRQTGAVQAPTRAEPRNRSTPRAMLNFIPDSDGLAGLIDGAMHALSRGIRWARGSILNLLV